MEIKEIKNRQDWENFFSDSKDQERTFLHSWNWGEFQKEMGEKIWRLAIYEKNEIMALALIVKVSARRGIFLAVPQGPVIRIKNEELRIKNDVAKFKMEILKVLLQKLKKIAKGENCSFIRIAPIWERTEENRNIFKKIGFKKAPIHIHPELSWILDLEPSEEQLLAGMRKTTRYLIKQGTKNSGLEIKKSTDEKDVEIFNNLYQKTVDRHNFTPFSLSYLKKELIAFARDNEILVFSAYWQEKCLASAMVVFWQGGAFYHQGASSQEFPKIPASYLLQWEAIKEAKKRGCKTYNFWGIADAAKNIDISKYRNHPWFGLTLFKTGFGGYEKRYLETQDFPISAFYWLTFLFEKIRRAKRNL